ncbi:MAG: DUF3098 domain-containing protein [Bacteroidota bacterium]
MKQDTNPLSFGKSNYQLLVLLLGFMLMALDQAPYGFGVLGLTIVVLGLVIEFFAIIYRGNR